MASAEQTAKELARLKEVGKWKMEAGDATDDFTTKYIPAKVAAGAQKAMEKAASASEQVVGTSQGTIESGDSAATDRASTAPSSAIIGKEPGVGDHASSAAAEAVNAVAGKADEATKQVVGKSTRIHESTASEASDSASSVASSLGPSASSIASKAPKKVYGGAMAQNVLGQKPILDDVISDDDDASYSEKMQDMVKQAGAHYADVTKAVSEALVGATTSQGAVESASSVADDQYSRALSAASSVLYGSETGAVESATSVAAGRYAQAVAA